MIVRCQGCPMFYDDEYRSTLCPHDTFAANDGHNRFAHHQRSYLSSATPSNVGHGGPTRSEPVTPRAQPPSGDVERVVRADDFTDWGAVADQVEKIERARDAFKGAFQILWNCHHGDEATCGCREHARSLIAALSPATPPADPGPGR